MTFIYATNFSEALQHQNATFILGADPALIVRLPCISAGLVVRSILVACHVASPSGHTLWGDFHRTGHCSSSAEHSFST